VVCTFIFAVLMVLTEIKLFVVISHNNGHSVAARRQVKSLLVVTALMFRSACSLI